jgi:tetratricopeptide (TPR) repeat protein
LHRYRYLAALAIVLAIGGVFAGIAVHVSGARRLSTELAAARQELDAGLVTLAHRRLIGLASKWPDEAEIPYELGRCAMARGKAEAAIEFWQRVASDSAWAGRAALASAEAAVALGRITDVERILRRAVNWPSPELPALRRMLIVILGQQGRLDEARDLIANQWRNPALLPRTDFKSRLALLRQSVGLDFEPFPLEWNLSQLDRPADSATAADRTVLALARAYLATRAGHFDQARVELEVCRQRRPDEIATWKAWLEWSLAADDPKTAREAMKHLPAQAMSTADATQLHAYFAKHHADATAERQALEELIKIDPGRSSALVRLAELYQQAGDRKRAEALRQQKADLDIAHDRYNRLYREDRYASHVEELARLAERLGRTFEARGFWELIQTREPKNAQAAAALARLNAVGRNAAGQPIDAVRSTADERGDSSTDTQPSLPKRALSKCGPVPRFEDRAAESGLASFVLDNGSSPLHQLPEAFCGGIGLVDFDGDGFLDVYCVQGGPFPPKSGGARPSDRLFKNRGDGSFVDVTEQSGIAAMPRGYGHGISVADYDNDGHPDLFITRWRSYALYHNRGDGTFEELTDQSGLDGDRDWPTSSAFADLDNDGDLDLYVCHYARWDPHHPRICTDPSGTIRTTCDPRLVESLPDHIFRNDHGRFIDVTPRVGIVDGDGRGLGVVAADFDGDGLVDLFVANDSTANFLFHNVGGFRFEEMGHIAGVAASAAGGYQAGMGIACGDLDGDGLPDLAVTNFYGESTSFFHNLGLGLFVDHTAAIGLQAPSRFFLGFGMAFFDANNDGHLDLITANGHISDLRPLFPCPMTAQLYLGSQSGFLTDVASKSGPVFHQLYVGRGLAVGDLDNDGRLDAVMAAQNDPVVMFHNETRSAASHFVTFAIEGTRSNRDGIGAQVVICSAGRRQVAQRFSGGSFQSASDPRLHFGLGSSDRIESLEIRWPSGTVDQYHDLAADRGYRLREGDPSPRPLEGFRR